MRSDFQQALALLKSGELAAVEKAVTLLQQAVFSFSMRFCGQREDAEDTMQDVLLKALRYLPKFDNPGALAKWLYTVAKNQCLMSRRRSKFAPKHELSLQDLMPDRAELDGLNGIPEVGPERSAMHREQAQRLREALRNLPAHYRIVVVLRDMEGFTDEETGEITGLQPGTVRIRLHRARLFLRRELARVKADEKIDPAAAREKSADSSRSARCRKVFAGLSDYLDGELDDFSCEEIQAHLDGCEPCKKFLKSLEATIQSCRESPSECPDHARAAELRKQLLRTYSRALAAAK